MDSFKDLCKLYKEPPNDKAKISELRKQIKTLKVGNALTEDIKEWYRKECRRVEKRLYKETVLNLEYYEKIKELEVIAHQRENYVESCEAVLLEVKLYNDELFWKNQDLLKIIERISPKEFKKLQDNK